MATVQCICLEYAATHTPCYFMCLACIKANKVWRIGIDGAEPDRANLNCLKLIKINWGIKPFWCGSFSLFIHPSDTLGSNVMRFAIYWSQFEIGTNGLLRVAEFNEPAVYAAH